MTAPAPASPTSRTAPGHDGGSTFHGIPPTTRRWSTGRSRAEDLSDRDWHRPRRGVLAQPPATHTSTSDLTYRLGAPMGDIVYALAQVPGVTIDSITTDSDLVDPVSTFKISKVEAKQGGEWVRLTRRSGLVVRGGQVLHARVTPRRRRHLAGRSRPT